MTDDLLDRIRAAIPAGRLDALRETQDGVIARAAATEASNEAAGLRVRLRKAARALRNAARACRALDGGDWFSREALRLERRLAWWAARVPLRPAPPTPRTKPPPPPPWPCMGQQLLLFPWPPSAGARPADKHFRPLGHES